MRDEQFKEFAAELDSVFSMYGKEPSVDQKGLFFRTLQAFPLRVVKLGLEAHLRDPQRGRFAPLPADVVAQITQILERDGRPGAEEAWAVCVRSEDEAETVVWTQEMAQAWGIARAVLPDEVGARMAFKEAYLRLVAESRNIGDRPVWSASLGSDPQRRVAVVTEALAAKKLPIGELPLALPAPQRGVPMLAFVGDLAARADAPEGCRARLLEIRERLASQAEAPSHDVAERARTEQLKAQTAARVAAHEAIEHAREAA